MVPEPVPAVMAERSQPIAGVDVGGTFTDLVYFAEGELRIFKLLSTRGDPSDALLEGLDRIGADRQAIISHGTTVATNAVLERKGARTALITTRGFRDVLAIGRQTRPALYRLAFDPSWQLVPAELRFEVDERASPTGKALVVLDPTQVEAVLDQVTRGGAEALAVCLLFSFAYPAHELLIKRAAQARGLPVCLSCEILPEFREYERTSTTVLNAYVSPLMADYLTRLERGLERRGRHALWIMQSSGGILSAPVARREAVRTLLSGPAAGVIGAFHVARAAGYDHVITFDMGGTSTDASLADGAIRRTAEGEIEGWPIRVPMTDIHTVGAGGGSTAWVDAGGALRVGPQSAGSDPGPACYGRGGDLFTVTDANLLLGRLDEKHFLGGRMMLDRAASQRAGAALAAALGLTPIALAEGVVQVTNARMEQAIRTISVARGFDPRAFTLLPFGGAGPMHALDLADGLRIARVLVPRYPGVLSALGLILADFTVDYSRTLMWRLEAVTQAQLEAAYDPLLAQGRAEIAAQGFGPESVRLEPALDLRYRGQSFELTVVQAERRDSTPYLFDPDEIARHFHAAHEQRYGYSRPGAPVELVNLRLTARGVRPPLELSRHNPAPVPDPLAARVGEARLRFEGRWFDAPVYERASLLADHALQGPALVVQEDATTVLTPGWRAEVDPWLNLVCSRLSAGDGP